MRQQARGVVEPISRIAMSTSYLRAQCGDVLIEDRLILRAIPRNKMFGSAGRTRGIGNPQMALPRATCAADPTPVKLITTKYITPDRPPGKPSARTGAKEAE